MRSPLVRIATTLAVAVGLASCSDAGVAPRDPRAAHLALAPSFSAQAATIFRSLSTFAQAIDNVHIVVRPLIGGDVLGAPLVDTTVAFPASASEITVNLDVTLPSPSVEVVANVELRDGTTVFFGGSASFTATQGETSSPGEPITLTYIGPGASATALTVSPGQLTLAPSGTVQLTATAYDASEHVVTGLPITFSTSDATVLAVSAAGLLTSPGKAGTATITVTGLNGLTTSTTFTVAAVTQLAVIAGDKQSGTAGSQLTQSFVVRALTSAGIPVVDAPITFIAPSGATVSPATARTNSAGEASATLTLPAAAGSYDFQAQVTGAPNVATSVGATATAGAPTAIAVSSGNSQSDTVRAVLQQALVARVTDALGNVTPGRSVTFSVTSGRAGLLAAVGTAPVQQLAATTDASGLASATLVLDTLAGAVQVTASVTGSSIAPATFSTTVRPGAATKLVMLTQPSKSVQATIKLAQQPAVQVTDQFGNAVALGGRDVNVSYQYDCRTQACGKIASPPGAPNATGSISDTISYGVVGTTTVATDANGVARFTDLALNEYAGTYLLQFYDANQALASAQSDPIAVTPGPAASIIAWGVYDTTYVSATDDTLYPTVQVRDAVGNGIAGVKITWDNLKLGQIDSTVTTTDANGIAGPGRWIMSLRQGSAFQLIATPDQPLENAPLSLYAFISVIGAAPAPLRQGPGAPFIPPSRVVGVLPPGLTTSPQRSAAARSRS